nr:MAG TPA: hypothetical protein [Caudoviricetes sp.]
MTESGPSDRMILSHKGPEGYCNNGRRLATPPERG